MLLINLASVFVCVVDQLLKLLVSRQSNHANEYILSCGVFDIVFTKNTGAAFGMLKGHDLLLRIGVVMLLLVVFAFVNFLWKAPRRQRVSAALVLGGGLSNFLDRVVRGYVVDYINLNFLRFPVFNLADVCVCVGCLLLVVFFVAET
ncbi:MAG: signal peptidase II [Oscillospiraceae bacterium]|jgi:signal peptidase II|nr:signal peptidase II [Oscillospiraceae bacterium]